jgi:hypothetical protein
MAEKLMCLDYLYILKKLCLAALPTIAFTAIVSFLDIAFNDSTMESRFDSVFGLTFIFFGAVYLWQNR